MTFVMNIGDDLHWLSLRCCCLYFKPNLPLLVWFFFIKRYCTCQLLLISTLARFKILQLLFIHTIVDVPSVVRSLLFRKSDNKFTVYHSEGSACYQSCAPH